MRALSLTEHNICVGWRETGLYPSSPNHVLNWLSDETFSSSSLPRQPLALISINDRRFLQSCKPSPLKDRMASIISCAEASEADAVGIRAQYTVLERDYKLMKEAVEARKKTRAGYTVANLKTHVLATDALIEQATATEAATAARKKKGKRKAVPDSEEGPGGDKYPDCGDLQVALEELQHFQDKYA